MFDYSGLTKRLREKGITKTGLGEALGFSSKTLAKIGKGEKLSARTLSRIADYLQCESAELCREISDDPILRRLQEEKEARLPGGLYHELQVRMTYNSNHMEGSRLTEDQTRQIFETRTLDGGDGMPVDDVLETVHHFRAIDAVIEHAEEPLTEAFIKELHRILKQDTSDARLSWFAIGGYKHRANMVGGHETAKPKDVPARMRELVASYAALSTVAFEDIVTFHAEFEWIHPFQDGNGRVGRLIALKECLRYGIVPFIIEDVKKNYYYRGLSKWKEEKGWLMDTCRDGQDTMRRLLEAFEIEA